MVKIPAFERVFFYLIFNYPPRNTNCIKYMIKYREEKRDESNALILQSEQ